MTDVNNGSTIPKIIHYCWFGRAEYPDLIKKCMQTWQEHLSDYEFKIWNEDNFDINCNAFVKQAYETKKWAFVSDYVRFFALYHQGGIYLDTDVYLLKSLNDFLEHDAFSGFETENYIPTAVMGAKKHNAWVKSILDMYEDMNFLGEDGKPQLIANTKLITEHAMQYGLVLNNEYQILTNGLHIYPQEYFCPLMLEQDEYDISETTYALHLFASSWVPYARTKKIVKVLLKRLTGRAYPGVKKYIKRVFYGEDN